ncbi:hypothetical protein LEN26_006854 [Aphanomyces euteiches]|nr:DNA-directed RNA polymerases I and III subunit RPAC2 [Aphanomyces cochlioides]KAH9127348.1 hypothetical protein AeMF1_002336 [Aphanomyces euteiches]KAH9134201.1 hypothetical protein LEN26_006854 [Aphanomyces euteiches]KAH9191980.1 hypothetical protein AeNC1_006038 [Aphanomyces euteiches]
MASTIVPKLQVHTASSASAKTFVFHDEDHTLGNAVRYMLMRNPDVDFAGYTIPHPSEPKMHVRVQTQPSKSANAAMRTALTDLKAVCAHVDKTFAKELKSFKKKQNKP